MSMPSGFFTGCTNFEISGGTFNDVRGNLNQRRFHHYNVQYNNANGRYNSPTIVSFGVPPSTSPPPRRGTWRGSYSGARIEPYGHTGRSSEPLAQIPPSRSNRISGRGNSPSPYDENPFHFEPESTPARVHGRGIPLRAQSAEYPLREPSGSAHGSLNGRRRGDPWAYSPAPMPSVTSPISYRDCPDVTMSDGETLHSDEEDESDDDSVADTPATLPSHNLVASEGR